MRRSVPWLVGLLSVSVACGPTRGAASKRPDGSAPDAGPGNASDAGDVGPPPSADAGTGDESACASGVAADSLAACLDRGSSPDACLASVPQPLCDSDQDGLPDDLEAALARAYAPVFAFNSGAHGGDPETYWPINAGHFVSHAQLFWRPILQSATMVDPSPDLRALGAERYSDGDGGPAYLANEAADGSDFWLCLNDHADTTLISSAALMLWLPGGIDLLYAAHPASGPLPASGQIFVFYTLLFGYNAFGQVDNHEGDWEGLGLFIDRGTGAVQAAYYGRHDTTDNLRLIRLDQWPAIDPTTEAPGGNVGWGSTIPHGIRFWDHMGLRHHPVGYVSTGSHAMYDYPANTYAVEWFLRDTHNGDLSKLEPASGTLWSDWQRSNGQAIRINFVNQGEGAAPADYAAFRGQWGCDDNVVGKSWPGPFGNDRHPRPVLDKVWSDPPTDP